MRKVIRALQLLLLLVLAVSLVMIVRLTLEDQEGASDYAEAAQIAGLVAPKVMRPDTPPSAASLSQPTEEIPMTPEEQLAGIDLEALQEINGDVVGWIMIPGTTVSYPLLQTGNNDYYLNHTWMKKYNRGGAIFLDWRDSKDFSDFHTIIYGHRMGNDTMFGTLKYYKSLEYWQTNPYIYLALDSGIYRWDIFAAYEASITSPVYDRDTPIGEQNFIRFCLDSSVINTGIEPAPGSNILTLSTCTGRGHASRWVVQAVLHIEQDGDI